MTAERPAIEGGVPVRAAGPVPFFRAAITDADIQAVVETLRSGWLTLGPRTAAFERACAERLGVPSAVATNSCTSALFLALRAAGIGPGDDVLVPSMTFASSVNVVRHLGARPVLVDIELESYGVDPEAVAAATTPRTRAVIAVDYAGHPCRVEELAAWCRDRGLFFLEDAAHAFGAAVGSTPVGGLADATAFSFYATKCITTGEGGMLTTRDADLERQVRLLGHHGMARDAWKRYSDAGDCFYELEVPGYKMNMTDVQAALGLSQLQREPALRESRTQVAARFQRDLADVEGIRLPQVRHGVTPAWHLFVIRIDRARLRVDRRHFVRALRQEGIVPSVHFVPYHRHPAGREVDRADSLERTEQFADTCVSLPLFPGMPEPDQRDVVVAVRKLARWYAR